jgi:hypothetical protein
MAVLKDFVVTFDVVNGRVMFTQSAALYRQALGSRASMPTRSWLQ